MTTAPVADSTHDHEGDYRQLRDMLQLRMAAAEPPVFYTEPKERGDLWRAFWGAIPEQHRQHYNCHACRRFVNLYGGLVTVDEETGQLLPVFWPVGVDEPPFFADAIRTAQRVVRRRTIRGVFFHDADPAFMGTPANLDTKANTTWLHMAAFLTDERFKPPRRLKPHQATAQSVQDHHMLARGLAEFDADTIRQALRLLKSGSLIRSEKFVPYAEWLLSVAVPGKLEKVTNRCRSNIIWRAAATAPPGWCHVKSGMLGTLLEDVKAGRSFGTIKRRWNKKMSGLKYQRPQAAPTRGAIADAEKLVAELGIEASLRRRFARLDEVTLLWGPTESGEPLQRAGVFAHITPKGALPREEIETPPTTMTWTKFRAKVLPDAKAVEVMVPERGNFFGMVTAADPDAPPILQWDSEDDRNPVSTYVYHGGSVAARWGLPWGVFAKLDGISLAPPHWRDEEAFKHRPQSALLIIGGARDTDIRELALFPETLKPELHGVRSVIEAHSKQSVVEGAEEASACGLAIGEGGGGFPLTLRVESELGRAWYWLDRWD